MPNITTRRVETALPGKYASEFHTEDWAGLGPSRQDLNNHAKSMKTLMIIPTYNEAENLSPLVQAIFSYAPLTDVLIVDDH